MTTITDRLMTSRATPHTAWRIAVRPGAREHWRVSWLPDRSLDRNDAITAMTIAELVRPGVATTDDFATIRALAAELDLGPIDASIRVLRPPHILDRRFHTLSTSCWCEPATAFDGHRAEAGAPIDFEALAGDPLDADGFPLEAPR